ncbi:MAG: dihydroorotase [Alphaproteobacteria bacterium]|nr:dihydroorotase [Alphaproteobacteria bacterium]
MSAFDLIVRGGTCVSHDGIGPADIAVRDGRIAGIGDYGRASAATVIDAVGLHLLPGAIDTQVHFREPGGEPKEDLESGSRAAVLGGITAVFEMPNTTPPTTTPAALADKLARARGRMWCEHAFFVGATPGNIVELAALERLPGCCGVKLFMGSSTGDLLVSGDAEVATVLRSGTRRIAVHAEDEDRLRERRPLAVAAAYPAAHLEWRDEEAALRATRRLVALARVAGRRVHVLHVSSAAEMEYLAAWKDIASVEVTPQHLTLSAPECYAEHGTFAQMNPPIRDASHRDRLWQGVREGVVDVLGSDHAPHTRAEKAKPYPSSPSGMPGVQTLLPLMLDHVNAGRLSLLRLMDLVCAGPARLFGLIGKGRLAVGYDADITVVDLRARRTIAAAWLASRCGWSPFIDTAVTGWPTATIIRGQVVMREGEVLGQAIGRPLRFQETLAPSITGHGRAADKGW